MILDFSGAFWLFCALNSICLYSTWQQSDFGYLHKISAICGLNRKIMLSTLKSIQQSNHISTHSDSFSVASIELWLAGTAAALSAPPACSIRPPVKVFGWVEDLCPRLDAQDLPLHQFVVETPTGHQLTVAPLFSHTALVDHYDVVCLLHCAQPMCDHQHCVLPHDVVQSLLNLQGTWVQQNDHSHYIIH